MRRFLGIVAAAAVLAAPAGAFTPVRTMRGGRVQESSTALNAGAEYEPLERSFIMVKPDGVQRGFVGEVIKRFEQRGFKLAAMKLMQASEDLLGEHYEEHKEQPFFKELVSYMSSGPVCAMVWEGKGVVETGRKMLGATDPLDSDPGTIRGDFGIHKSRNICHGSDGVESAQREINLWFDESEIVEYMSSNHDWIYKRT